MSTQPPILVTNSTCDLPAAVFRQYGITVIPMNVTFGEQTFRSGVDLTMKQFFDRLKAGENLPTTSSPSVDTFLDTYTRLAAGGTPILSIHLSDALSTTIKTANSAARQLAGQPITVWDSRTISGALGFQVLAAARAAAAGYSVEQIIPLLRQTHEATNFLFCMDDLSYLVRGGRIGTVSYYVAQTLHLRPVVTVSKTGSTEGTYVSTSERVRSLSKAIDAFVDQIVSSVGRGKKLRALALYGDDPTPELAHKLNARLRETFDCVWLESASSTPVLGAHVGPLSLAVAYAAGDWAV